MEMDATPTVGEIGPSNPQFTESISSEVNGDRVALVASEKRKREEEESNGVGEEAKEDSKNKAPLWKTSLCSYFRRNIGGDGCSHGDACRYAHGEAELRPRPDNTWDPTSNRAKKLMKSDGAGGDGKVEALAAPEVTVDEESLDKCLIGLPRKWASDNLKSFLDGQGIFYKSAKKKKGMPVGFVTFENTEHLKSAIEILNQKSTGGKEIKVVDAIRKSHEKKHKMENSFDQSRQQHGANQSGNDDSNPDMESNLVKLGTNTEEETSLGEGLASKTKAVRDVVTPLAHMPYNEQLDYKKNGLLQILKRLTRNARKACPDSVPLPEWVIKSREIGGLPCKLEGILESPIINGYRSKCEFSVGYSLQGKRTVGFMLGNFREGVTAVEEPVNCPNVSKISCKYAMIFQDFLQSSVLPVWSRIDNIGFWRQLMVREGRDPVQVAVAQNLEPQILEVMLVIQVCSSGVDEELMKTEFDNLSRAFAQGAAACSPPLPLTTIIVQDHKGISNAAPADCPLIPLLVPQVDGSACPENFFDNGGRIHDYISNLRFSISPTAFFQVNSLAAERLYNLAGDWADLNHDTLLFDICCGTGTIGLTLANRVGMVVGIEMNESAVIDAQRNAVLNGVNNCRFVCGKAEDVMGSLLKEYLGVPQQAALDCNGTSATNSTENYDSATNNADNGGTFQHDACTSRELVCATADEMLDSSGDRSNEKFEASCEESSENNGADNCYNGSSEHELSSCDAKSSVILKSCTTGPKDTIPENQNLKDVSRDNCLPEEKGVVIAPLCRFKNVVAIVDPPRVGLHPIVIKALRTHPRIRRLVYISCNPESLVANAIELCTPTADVAEKRKGNRGWRNMSSAGLARQRTKSMPNSEPFRPVRAMAVDLFPHTPHCELVMLLER
ncbi:zinc finger CCCH domain-containing protein 24 [Typha latifolia]|uniref:zinc finger CCCH domain-containing protein 24 n=1 Tax=Typha latifolia TaxID=4733 RepID=UPI003C2B817D